MKQEYEAQQLTEYKTNRVKIHAPYKIWNFMFLVLNRVSKFRYVIIYCQCVWLVLSLILFFKELTLETYLWELFVFTMFKRAWKLVPTTSLRTKCLWQNGHIFANQPTFFLFGRKRFNKLFRHGSTLHRLFYMAENGQIKKQTEFYRAN